MTHVTALLSDYLDGELDEQAARDVQAHLETCDRCSRRLRSLRRTVRFLQSNGRVDVNAEADAGAIARFNRALMRPDALPGEAERVLLEELQRALRRVSSE